MWRRGRGAAPRWHGHRPDRSACGRDAYRHRAAPRSMRSGNLVVELSIGGRWPVAIKAAGGSVARVSRRPRRRGACDEVRMARFKGVAAALGAVWVLSSSLGCSLIVVDPSFGDAGVAVSDGGSRMDAAPAGDGGVPLCGRNERVVNSDCIPCPVGTASEPGADPNGPDTRCDPRRCGEDEEVDANACLACPAGSTNEAGDDASGPDTDCDVMVCGSNEHVVRHVCETCPDGETNLEGDLATGDDTLCDGDLCASNQRVMSAGCVPCEPMMQ